MKETTTATGAPLPAPDLERLKSLPSRLSSLLRREQVWGFLVSMAIMVIVSIAFFYPDSIDGNSLAQADMIQGAANGEEGRAYEEATGEKALWTNSLFSGMPTFQISPKYPSNSLFSWINSVYGLGLPTPSNLMFMMMFGFLIMLTCMGLRWWYALIGALAWGLSSYFVIIIGAGHIWKFVALSYVPPTIAGFIMIYRGRHIAGAAILALFMMMELNANHPQITYYFTFLMAFLAIGFLVTAIRTKRMRGWMVSTGVALVAGLLALGANLPSIYNTYEYSKETKRAASELTPVKDPNAPASTGRPTGGLPKEEIGGWSNRPEESLSLLIPNIKGGATIKPYKGSMKALSLRENDNFDHRMDNAQPVIEYNGYQQQIDLLGQLNEYFGGKDFTNGPFYVGALIVALFILGCFIISGPIKWVMLIATLFSAMLAMGNHFETLTDFMIYNVPLYNKFRAAETALVIACLAMPTLAILALRKLLTMENPWGERTVRRGLSVALVFPAFICLMAFTCPSLFGPAITDNEMTQINALVAQLDEAGININDEITATVANIETIRYGIVSDDALRSLIVLLFGGAVIFMYLRGTLSRGITVATIGVIITVDLYSVDKRYVDHDSFVPKTLTTQLIEPDDIDRAIMADEDYYRVADLAAFGDARRSYFHHMIGGYHAAKLNRYNDLIERQIAKQNPAVLDMLNTRYIIYPSTDAQGQQTLAYERNPYALGPAWLVDTVRYVDTADAEMAALDNLNPADVAVADRRFAGDLGEGAVKRSEGDYIKLDEYTPNSLTYTVDTRNGGVAVFSEIWFPWGWTATVDGTEVPIARVNYVLRALRLTPGRHTVVMTFDPESLHVTGGIAYGAVTLIYLLCLTALFICVVRNDKQSKDKNPQKA